ncbi:YgfZ/GcvT domain-containing protein [[Mycobacterium] burgundiense]|uniref:Folate-binding protein n=1 Tax=[Mycobacterium] burgundiense TaxID=3064286 RepID=A0ABM9LBT2_9MYCO|nr:folate-binding protein [Mycolicibacterium sp. MU0053]CAJ1496316.1 folate-binding protein [Mycolicibacterium sp. MU0053]
MTAAPVPAPETDPDAGAIWHYGDPLGEQRAASTAAVVVDRSHRGVLTITGAERQSWLHTLCTQHVAELPDGASTANSSLDGQGRVEDFWIQTELDGVTYLDTEAWRAEPLLAYLTKMVFWADAAPAAADLAVLSLIGPGLDDPALREALSVSELPATMTAVALPDGGFLRRMPSTDGGPIELDLVVPQADKQTWLQRLERAGARRAGVWAYEAHRVAAVRARLGVDTDERTIPHEVAWIGTAGAGAVHLDKGCYRGQETVSRVHNLGRPPRMLVLLHLDGSADRPSTGDPVVSGGRTVGRLGTVVDHVDEGAIALALLKRGLPADTPLSTGGEVAVDARIDAETLPPADTAGAGKVAIARLRGRAD